jgi:hypothetical protein
MKKAMLAVLMMLCLLSLTAGCSSFQASKSMATTIDTNAAKAITMLATSQPVDAAKAAMATNSTILSSYYSTATVNPFAYLFGDKQIWCTATYYSILAKNATSSSAWATQAAAGVYSDAEVQSILAEEYKWLKGWKAAKDGTE